MRIYLLKTPEFSEDEFNNVFSFLDTFEGPLEFLKVDLDFDKEKFPFLKKFYPDFKFKYESDITKIEFNSERGTPLSWRELFSLCVHYRKTFNIDPNDFVVLLTNRRNALNWFSAFDNDRNIFVHTNEWDIFTNANPKYPIAYQVLENIVKQLMQLDIDNTDSEFVHKSAKGCMNDFCNNKEEVILRLQTANICDKCMEKIQSEGINEEIIEQTFRIFEGVRNELIYKKRKPKQVKIEPLPVTITSQNKILIELPKLELRLKPMEKALYLFYLKQEKGILFKDLIDYKSQLLEIYRKVSTSDDLDEQEKRIKSLVNPLEGSFNIQKSRINKTVTDILGEEMSLFYKIDGTAGNPFKINLPKHLIQYQS
jgi:hypothetical protein